MLWSAYPRKLNPEKISHYTLYFVLLPYLNLVQITSSWNKSIEICSVRNGSSEVVAKSEHPITLDEASANVPCIQEKMSQEEFGGAIELQEPSDRRY